MFKLNCKVTMQHFIIILVLFSQSVMSWLKCEMLITDAKWWQIAKRLWSGYLINDKQYPIFNSFFLEILNLSINTFKTYNCLVSLHYFFLRCNTGININELIWESETPSTHFFSYFLIPVKEKDVVVYVTYSYESAC